MYKTGIWHLAPISRLQSRGVRDVTSYRLLTEVSANPSSIEIFETIVRHLRLSSGIYRSTYPHRFADLEPAINAIVEGVFQGTAITVHDWAASDCLASAEWAESLWRIFPSARLTASDVFLSLMAVSQHGGRDLYVLEPDGAPLQYIRPPFVISLQKPIPLYYPFNRLLVSLAKRKVPRVQEILRHYQFSNSSQQPPGWTIQEISLIHPLARRLLAETSQFEIRAHSVFTPLQEACHVLRTMNILNPGYFDESKLRRGVRCVFDSVAEGGIWVLGRTREETRPPVHSVSIFQRTKRGFALLQRMNGGSEIERLVLEETPE
jgi:hypothetical protein